MSDYQRKAIDGFPGYEIDTEGIVWSYWKHKSLGRGKGHAQILTNLSHKLKQSISFDKRHKYGCSPRVELRRNYIARQFFVHRLVAKAFILNPDNLPLVCHNDSNPLNNNVENLRWDTQKGNMKDRINRALYGLNKGEKCGTAKLTNEKVREIKKLLLNQKSNLKIAKLFNVCADTIYAIRKNETWKHITI